MQVKKEEVEQAILEAARQEFMEKGFMGTGLREIAARASISTSNIYNYFDNKDELFETVLKPVTSLIQSVFRSLDIAGVLNDKNGWDIQQFRSQVREVLDFIQQHQEDLLLLVKQSQGSSLHGYKQRLIDRFSYSLSEKTNFILRQVHPESRELREEFFRAIAAFYFQTLEDLILHPVPEEGREAFILEISAFIYYGWRSLLRTDIAGI